MRVFPKRLAVRSSSLRVRPPKGSFPLSIRVYLVCTRQVCVLVTRTYKHTRAHLSMCRDQLLPEHMHLLSTLSIEAYLFYWGAFLWNSKQIVSQMSSCIFSSTHLDTWVGMPSPAELILYANVED